MVWLDAAVSRATWRMRTLRCDLRIAPMKRIPRPPPEVSGWNSGSDFPLWDQLFASPGFFTASIPHEYRHENTRKGPAVAGPAVVKYPRGHPKALPKTSQR